MSSLSCAQRLKLLAGSILCASMLLLPACEGVSRPSCPVAATSVTASASPRASVTPATTPIAGFTGPAGPPGPAGPAGPPGPSKTLKVQPVTQTSGSLAQGAVAELLPTCPNGTLLTGGGYYVYNPAGFSYGQYHMQYDVPNGNAWYVAVRKDGATTLSFVTAYALCASLI